MKADQLVVLPPEIDDETAAAAMLKGMTAEYLLRRVRRVRRGDVVLVHAAAGATGQLLCQWASHLGATVIGTVGGEEKARVARDAGCAHPLVGVDESLGARVRELSAGRGADVIYDGIGRDSFAASLDALALCGHLVSYGQASGAVAPIDPAALSAKSATLTRPVLFHYTREPATLRAMAGNVFAMIRRGALRVQVAQRYPLAAAADAHRALEARRTTGASILLA
jgi:NADPH:quinone reductase-like Zn-dependent oxidoreductase